MFDRTAARYLTLGWKVFPLARGSKLPTIKGGHGFKDATSDPQIASDWARRFPDCNIAIATGEASGIAVIDVDPRNGGNASISRHASQGRLLPPCPTAKTGNGGRHYFFRLPANLKASKDRLGKGIDVKSTGGYVVAAPSWIAASAQGSGGSYSWIVPPEDVALPPLPGWILERLFPKLVRPASFARQTSSVAAHRSLEGMAARLSNAGKGTRNDLLNWAAYQAGLLVVQGKLSGSLADQRLTQAGLASGLPLNEIRATIGSAFRAAASGFGAEQRRAPP